jgi:hypothetical protein
MELNLGLVWVWREAFFSSNAQACSLDSVKLIRILNSAPDPRSWASSWCKYGEERSFNAQVCFLDSV